MKKQINRESESGNVLFLILIAVALFAALSYAVTQSTRSGGGSTEREKSILSSASMTQHPTGMRTSVIRMVLAGTDIRQMYFNAPANFAGTSAENLVFHPKGGGAVFQVAPSDVMAGNSQGGWFFNANFDIPQIGIDGVGGNDIIAFLPGVSTAICEKINEEFVVDTTNCTLTGVIPQSAGSVTEILLRDTFVDGDTFPSQGLDHPDIQGLGGSCAAFTRQPSGCFEKQDTTVENVFYSVLLER